MADTKISDLVDGGAVQVTDNIPVERSGGNNRVQVGSLATKSTIDTADINNDAVTYAKIQNVSTGDVFLGRQSGSGIIQEVPMTQAGRDLVDDADASAQRSTLGLGGLAIKSSVTTSDINDDAVTYPKMQDVSATDKILGRSSAGAGVVEEIDCTAAGRAILDDNSAADQRATLGSGAVGDSIFISSTPGAAQQAMDVEVGVDVQAYDADTAKTDVAQEYTQQQNFNATSLSDAANISWDLNSNQVASVTLGGNRTLDNPTNMKDGGTYILIVKQDATPPRTLAYGTAYKWSGGSAPTLSTGANAVDILTFVSDGTNMFGVFQGDFS